MLYLPGVSAQMLNGSALSAPVESPVRLLKKPFTVLLPSLERDWERDRQKVSTNKRPGGICMRIVLQRSCSTNLTTLRLDFGVCSSFSVRTRISFCFINLKCFEPIDSSFVFECHPSAHLGNISLLEQAWNLSLSCLCRFLATFGTCDNTLCATYLIYRKYLFVHSNKGWALCACWSHQQWGRHRKKKQRAWLFICLPRIMEKDADKKQETQPPMGVFPLRRQPPDNNAKRRRAVCVEQGCHKKM